MTTEQDETFTAELFDTDRAENRPNDERANAIMGRLRRDVAGNDITEFAIVRIWLAVLEFGAHLYAARTKRQPPQAVRT